MFRMFHSKCCDMKYNIFQSNPYSKNTHGNLTSKWLLLFKTELGISTSVISLFIIRCDEVLNPYTENNCLSLQNKIDIEQSIKVSDLIPPHCIQHFS